MRRKRETLLPTESLTRLEAHQEGDEELARRLTYLMALRVLLITLVLGATTLLYWLGDVDLTQPNSLVLYGIIGVTYLLTIFYAHLLRDPSKLPQLASAQLAGDLAIATVLMHVTGGAQSAYTFFFPLAIIGSAAVRYRTGAIVVSLAAATLFVSVSFLGWKGLLPVPEGQRLLPNEMTPLQLGRAMALNLAAIAGVGTLAVQLAAQLQRTSADLEVHRSVTADLLSLHGDIVRCLTSGLVTVDIRGKIATINDAAAEILDCTPESSIGVDLHERSRALAELIESIPLDQPSRRSEVAHASENDTLVLGVSVSPLYDHTSEVIGRILNFQDLTEVREMEQHLRRAERLSVIGGLAAGVAHEIRNPLAAISGSVELLKANPDTDEDSAALMAIVNREIERLNALITELLDYANPKPTGLVETDLMEVIRDTLRVFAQDTRFESIRVDLAGAEKAPLRADPEKLRQVLWNLLTNGAQAAGEGGHLEVTVEPAKDELCLEVADSGPGIPLELQEKIFDPFFTTKAKGSGLGLATVHAIVSEHGGTVSAESRAGEGARFRVCLPYDGVNE